MSRKFKAVIFDMDGLMVDSMIHWLKLDEKWFEERGLELTQDIVKYFTGRSIKENVTYLKDTFDLKESIDEIIQERKIWENNIYTSETEEMPGIAKLLETIHKSPMRQAIASGAPMTAVDAVADRFKWRHYFDELISSDHVEYVGKPDPGIFLHTADKLGIDPKDC
ncbi:HAD family phosphatase, partial [Candidatus Parcubacteria bacterium]|nr:HAD family phosphatase [Candidatus Parcubacteria bacterium]